ncbi:hypothetical protein H2201_003540 [Coniosporium apollinis]|uniref:BZIP domain-containing protein n=1 Tax=Coniosporium apollinis TaxID=61459 RepID=A0ABQ9P1T3_9PEZI|nr:hypothetical protein H2201_003540 [Coniosporium apollinis]
MVPTPPQTLRRAKAAYKKGHSTLSEAEAKRIERLEELERRACRAKLSEQRRKEAERKRLEKEEKERQARRQLGVGLATQLAGYSHTQVKMKGVMEAFVCRGKRKRGDEGAEEPGGKVVVKKVKEEIKTEPWDDEEMDDVLLRSDGPEALESPAYSVEADTSASTSPDPWEEDDIDDATLLDASKEGTPYADSSRSTPPVSQAAEYVTKVRDFAYQASHPVNTHIPSNTNTNCTLQKYPVPIDIDCWDDILDSNTQIDRDIAGDWETPPSSTLLDQASLISTQDLDLFMDNLEELSLPEPAHQHTRTNPAPHNHHHSKNHYPSPVRHRPPVALETAKNLNRAKADTDRRLMPPPLFRKQQQALSDQSMVRAQVDGCADLYVSTQVLQDIAFDDITLSPEITRIVDVDKINSYAAAQVGSDHDYDLDYDSDPYGHDCPWD